MRPIHARFTVRGLVLANLVVAVVLAWLASVCDGDIYHFDGRKLALSAAVVFGLPALVALLGGRGPGQDRGRACRAGLGLHCAMMIALCALPSILWAHYFFVRHGPRWPGDAKYIYGAVVPSLAHVVLYGLGGLLVVRSRSGRESADRSGGSS